MHIMFVMRVEILDMCLDMSLDVGSGMTLGVEGLE